MVGTKLKFSSAYHPQTYGQAKVNNRTIETHLQCFINNHPRQWVKWLCRGEFWFNSSYNASIKMSPYRALYGRNPSNIIPYRGEGSIVAEVDEVLLHRDSILAE